MKMARYGARSRARVSSVRDRKMTPTRGVFAAILLAAAPSGAKQVATASSAGAKQAATASSAGPSSFPNFDLVEVRPSDLIVSEVSTSGARASTASTAIASIARPPDQRLPSPRVRKRHRPPTSPSQPPRTSTFSPTAFAAGLALLYAAYRCLYMPLIHGQFCEVAHAAATVGVATLAAAVVDPISVRARRASAWVSGRLAASRSRAGYESVSIASGRLTPDFEDGSACATSKV